MNTVLAIVGPTASGKTPLSLLLAEYLDAEVVSADSRQVYKYLDIGTAKPAAHDLKRIKHHFINILDPREEYSAGQYGKDAYVVVQKILEKGKTPVLAGGSGLYVKAVVDGLFDGPGKDEEVRERFQEQLKSHGVQSLLDRLRSVDPVSAAAMDREPKARRIIRALEVHAITGVPLSQFHKEQETEAQFEVRFFGLRWKRSDLYRMIDARVDRMLREGLIEEVESLRKLGYSSNLNSLNTVGYKEVYSFLEGRSSRDEAVERIKQNSRRYAKRQLTWFNADKRIHWIELNSEIDLKVTARQVREEYEAHRS